MDLGYFGMAILALGRFDVKCKSILAYKYINIYYLINGKLRIKLLIITIKFKYVLLQLYIKQLKLTKKKT